ncbi:MAG: hypothetical protein QY309_15270 [Cyclobacteriaceae bacterium]|nr:MAG: hypothetical protein QY309_15270 [Cyclobacteriaceae bacterium]
MKALFLFKVENQKLILSNYFWIILALYAVLQVGLMPILSTKAETVLNIQPADVQPAVLTLAHYWIGGALKFLPAMIIIISQSNEFEYKTIRQTIMDGWSKLEFVLSKTSGVLMVAALSVLVTLVASFASWRPGDPGSVDITVRMLLSVGLFIEITTYLMITLLITTIVRNPALVLVALGLLTAGEFLLVDDLESKWEGISQYFPIYALNHPFEPGIKTGPLHFNFVTIQTSLMTMIGVLILNVFYLKKIDL